MSQGRQLYNSQNDNVSEPYDDEVNPKAFISSPCFLQSNCKEYYKDYLLCREMKHDPSHCHKKGREVTRCSIEILRKLEQRCGESFNKYFECLDDNKLEYRLCREPEKAFNACVLLNMGYGDNFWN